jgi:hypothetical protein
LSTRRWCVHHHRHQELVKEQEDMVKMAASPNVEALQVWTHHYTKQPACGHHCGILCGLQCPLTKAYCQLPNVYHTCRWSIHDAVQNYMNLFNKICYKRRHDITSFIYFYHASMILLLFLAVAFMVIGLITVYYS